MIIIIISFGFCYFRMSAQSETKNYFNENLRYKFARYPFFRNILGLHSQGIHGVWGWADENNKMIQDRSSENVKFVDAPYLHATFLQRGSSSEMDLKVIKRSKKLKYELGKDFPKDYFYPEVFFKDKPDLIPSPWKTMSPEFKSRSFIETPLRKINRKIFNGKVGY